MEPSTTPNSRTSHENQHKNHTTISTNDQLPSDDHQQSLIISCKEKNSPNIIPSTCVIMENVGDVQEIRGLENEPNGRGKLMSHWREVSDGGGGRRIVIPERWGQEALLKEWTDCSTFDALLAPKEAGLAREAIVAEARRRGRVMSKLSM